jgi:hypothetical protein
MADTEPTVIPTIPPADDKPPKRVSETKPKGESKPKDPPQVGPKGPGTTGTATGKPGKFHRELAEFLSVPAVFFQMKGDTYCAYVWAIRSEPFAYSLADLAEKNPSLKRWITRMIEGGVYGQVIISGAMLVVPILAYYNLYPKGLINPFELRPDEVQAMQQMQAERSQREAMMSDPSYWDSFTMGNEDEGVPYVVS